MPTDSVADLPIQLDRPVNAIQSEIHSLFRKPKYTSSEGMLVDGELKYLTHTFPDSLAKKYPRLQIIYISDVQFGHVHCNVGKFQEYLTWILEEENRFLLLGGDLVDAWRVGSPGTGYDNWCQPDSQIFRFCQMIAPVRHRILSTVGGNHERRGLAGGVDLGKLLSLILEIPYSSGAQMVSIRYGEHTDDPSSPSRHPFRIYNWHGRGAARSAGGRVNMTLSAVPNDEAQVYISGHIHHPHVYPEWRTKRDEAHQRVYHEKYYVVSASHFLEFYGTYMEQQGGTYTGLLMPVTNVYADGGYRVEI